MRLLCGLVAMVSLNGCKHHFECAAHGGSVVRQVETRHFIVTSDLEERVLTRQAAELEQLWAAWGVFFHRAPDTPAKLNVLLSREGATDEFMEGHSGFVRFSARPVLMGDLVLGDSANGGTRYYSSNAHEMAHFVSYFVFRRQPRWFAEGLASYLDDADFVRADAIRMGNWQWSRSTPDSLETMWSWDEVIELGDVQQQRYASAWAWVHFLTNREEERFTRAMYSMQNGESARAGFEEVFPPAEWPELHRRLRAYLSEGRYRGWETSGLAAPRVSKARTLAPWEVHLLRRLYADGAKARLKEAAIAKELAGEKVPAEVTLALFEDARGPEQSEVLAALPGNPRAELLASYAPDLSPLRCFQLAESAAKQLPDDVQAQARFSLLAAQRDDPRSVKASIEVLAMAPWWEDGYFIHADALHSQGHCAEARETLNDARGLVRDGDTRLTKRIAKALNWLDEHCREKK